nr:reverse transcriptase domain-containing protein [Tanacetum cinerariifolium]
MAANENGDDGPPAGGGDLPVPDLRTMEELCQPTLNGRAKMFFKKYFPPSMETKLRNEITNFRQRPNESLFKACERYKLLIDRCSNYNMLPITQIDTFYNGLSLRHRDTINAAASGTFMKRCPEECYDLIENMIAHHNDWDTSAQRSDDANKHLDKFLHVTQSIKVNGVTDDALRLYLFPHSLTHHSTAWVTKLRNEITNFRQHPDESLFEAWERGTFMKRRHEECYDLIENMTTNHNDWDTSVQRTTVGKTQNVYAAGAYNQSGASDGQNPPPAYQAPAYQALGYQAPVHQGPIPQLQVVTTTEFTNYVKRQNFQIFQDLDFNISFTDALIFMPKFGPTIKSLLSNREKLFELARTPLNEHCSVVLLKKLPEKLGDPGKFLIPCDLSGMDKFLALDDLDASINLMPLSRWNKLSLPELSPTCMTLELADRLISRPVGVAEDVFVKVGTFHFPADFVVIDFDADPRVLLFLRRSLSKTERALIDVYKGELTLRVGNKAIPFNLDQTLRYTANYDAMSVNRIDLIDVEFLNDDPSSPPLPPQELKVVEPKNKKSSVDEPPVVKLKDLPPQLEYVFLDGDDKFPVIIAKDLKDEEKSLS